MSHKVTLTIPNDCTVEQFEGLLKDNGISYEDTKYKTELTKRMKRLNGGTSIKKLPWS